MLSIEHFYLLLAAFVLYAGWRNLRERRYAHAAFWSVLAILFAAGRPILDASKAGHALPSDRQIAAEYQLNPITVSKAYQELVDENLVEKRRGIGMYVTEGASEKLLATERERFIREEWPAMVERIRRLGLNVEQLLKASGNNAPGGSA